MKCAYKQEIAKQRQARDELKLINQEHTARADLFALALLTARDQFGFDKDQLKQMLDGMFEEAGDAFEHYKDETEKEYDPNTVPFLLQGFINQLDALEVDVRAIEKWHHHSLPETIYWSNRRRATLEGRMDVLEDRKISYRAYMYAFCLYLYHEYEYEGKKLSAYYNEVLNRYYKTWDMYVLCNDQQDSFLTYQVHGHILDVKKQFNIDLMEATDLDRGKKGQETDGIHQQAEEDSKEL